MKVGKYKRSEDMPCGMCHSSTTQLFTLLQWTSGMNQNVMTKNFIAMTELRIDGDCDSWVIG